MPFDPSDNLSNHLDAALSAQLADWQIETADDLYECVVAGGPAWYRPLGLTEQAAGQALAFLDAHQRDIGELPGPLRAPATDVHPGIVPLEVLRLPEGLTGEDGSNRAPRQASSLGADNDLDALQAWLKARATNANTLAAYRKEGERFLLWCLVEKHTCLSSIGLEDARDYLPWLEGLGRTADKAWKESWQVPQGCWIGPKNRLRTDPAWKPFNGPLSHTSRKTALTVVRQLFTFLKNTGYIIFSPFDQVSRKVPYLKGEGAPREFAERSLSPLQWDEMTDYLSTLQESESSNRIRAILTLGKGLGMRASEILASTAGWFSRRELDGIESWVISITGKGEKVRLLPVADEQVAVLDQYLASRGAPCIGAALPGTPLITELRKESPLSRSGLHRILKDFLEKCAQDIEIDRPVDAAKFRASSTHWLRHTFATEALRIMPVNIVQNAMGHASVGTTSRYLTPEAAEVARYMRKFGKL